MKRILSLVLAALLMLGCCSFALAEDTKTISYFAFWCADHVEGSYIETKIEEALGIDIKVRNVAHSDADAVNLMLAQDMPDCGWFGRTVLFMQDQELIRTIPVDMVREYAPSLIEAMDKYPMLWAKALDPEDPSQLLYIPDMYETYVGLYMNAWYLRYDWILNLGIDLGDVNVEQVSERMWVADKGLSLETFEAIIDGFNNGDPDGNGIDDTEGYTYGYDLLMSAFGLINGNQQAEDGSVQMWYTDPRCKELLAYVAGLYAEGNIYQEIFTLPWAQQKEMVRDGKGGIFMGSSTNALNSWNGLWPPVIWNRNEEHADTKVLAIPGIADETGHTYYAANTSPQGGENFYVRWDISDEKLIEILKFYEYTNWNKDDNVTAMIWYGEEGVDFVYDENGMVVAPEGKQLLTGGNKDAQIFGRNTQMGRAWEWLTLEPEFVAGAKYWWEPMGGLWNVDRAYEYKADVYNETEAAAIANEYSAEWQQVRNAYFLDVITGAKNLEADWDAYIQDLNDIRYGEYLAELEKAPATLDVIASFAN